MLVDPEVHYAAAARRRCLEICEEIVVEIRVLAPLRKKRTRPRATPGTLRAGYRARENPNRPGAEIVTSVPYWNYVEVGTRKMKAQPHIKPAVEIVRRRHMQ